jgi:hypothetical protein
VVEQSTSHQKCRDAGEHICQRPSGRTCIEEGCDQPAGTLWGPLWCPEHDQERLDRIGRQMSEILEAFR